MRHSLKLSLWVLLLGLLAVVPAPVRAQVASVEYDGWKDIVLSDGTQVRLRRSLQRANEYYYAPTSLHLSRNQDGTPTFLFLKFTTEKRETQGGIQGGLIHFLMEYGLNEAQMDELNAKLAKIQPGAKCVGSVPVIPDGETSTFQITSATLSDKDLTKSLVTSGKVPLVPGGKAAAAARLTANGAQLLAATFDQNLAATDLSLSFNLAYVTQVAGVTGYMHIYGEKLKQSYDSLRVDYHNTHRTTGRFLGFLWETSGEDSVSYEEARTQYEFLRDRKIVVTHIDQRVDNELANKITQTFLQMFMDACSQKESISPEDAMRDRGNSKSPEDSDPKAPAVSGNHYKLRRYKFSSSQSITDRHWYFTARIPITEHVQLTGNLKEWYNNVKDNPKCVAAVNLNDPFFTHRDVRFILDLDAKEMYDQFVNYVTVTVHKKRSNGRDFEDHLTIDAQHVKDKGVSHEITYARGDDSNPDVYQYQAQWSLKGGNLYPENPPWITGSWEGVTLAPPVRPVTIEFEAAPDELKAKDLTRASAVVRYQQFGKEVETDIQLPLTTTPPLVAQKLYMDRDKQTFSYRLVFYHKTLGRLTTPPVTNVTSTYIYASIPDDLLTSTSYRGVAKGSSR